MDFFDPLQMLTAILILLTQKNCNGKCHVVQLLFLHILHKIVYNLNIT